MGPLRYTGLVLNTFTNIHIRNFLSKLPCLSKIIASICDAKTGKLIKISPSIVLLISSEFFFANGPSVDLVKKLF